MTSRLLLRWLSAIPFRLGQAHLKHVYIAYQPDSYAIWGEHKEFGELFKRFSLSNRLNNAGDIARLWSFVLNTKQVIADNIDGAFAELGVWRGNSAAILAHIASQQGRDLFLFDTFEGFDSRDTEGIDRDKAQQFADTSIEKVKKVLGADERVCHFVKGFFPDSLTDEHKKRRYAVVSLDCDLYAPMKAGLDFFYPRMPKGGLLMLHDYSSLWWEGAKQAIDEFCQETGEYLVLLPDKSGSAFVRKSR